MKKLTLDQTWKLCLSMWRWIAKQKREGSTKHVKTLKRLWTEKHNIDDEYGDCLFCYYDDEREADCSCCPGSMVDNTFRCASNKKYHFSRKPIAFYNKLVSLNRKRKK